MSEIQRYFFNSEGMRLDCSQKGASCRGEWMKASDVEQRITALEAENAELRGLVVTSRKKEFWIEPLDKKRTCVEDAFEKGSLKEALAWLSQKYVCKSYKIIVYRGSKRTSCCGTVIEKLNPIEEYVWCEGKGIVKQEATDES